MCAGTHWNSRVVCGGVDNDQAGVRSRFLMQRNPQPHLPMLAAQMLRTVFLKLRALRNGW